MSNPAPGEQRIDPTGEFLRNYLRGRDVACPGCGYNVRDLVGARCPECGQELVMSVRLSEPRQGALITGLVGLASGAGFGGLLLIFCIISFTLMRRGGPPTEFYIIIVPGFVIHCVAMWFWIRRWNAIRRISRTARTLLVIGTLILPIAFVVVFSVAIR